MFTEILRIKPVLDAGATKQMEANLSARFANVARKFGSGLKNVMKGTILGISLGLLNKVLNPLEAVEKKITDLLGQGSDVKDLAERLNTSGGKLKQTQDVAQALGVKPEDFKDALLKYVEAVDRARDELANPTQERSASTQILGEISNTKDLLDGFTQFLTKLKITGRGAGIDQPLTQNAAKVFANAATEKRDVTPEERSQLLATGQLRNRSGKEARDFFEKEIFGSTQFGGMKKLIDANIPEEAKKIGEPGVDKLNAAVNKVSELEAKRRVIEVQNQTADFLTGAKNLNEQIIKEMEERKKREEAEVTDRIASYKAAAQTAEFVAEISNMISDLSMTVVSGFKMLADLVGDIKEIRKSGIWRTIFKGGK